MHELYIASSTSMDSILGY